MSSRWLWILLLITAPLYAQPDALARRARRYFTDLVRIDTTNPPGNETPAAGYIRGVLAVEGIPAELLGGDKRRLNVVARLGGSGAARPLLLMAHTDVVPADRSQWTVDPFAGKIESGFLYGRGALDDKCLLAAEMAVLVELKRRGVKLARDVILLGEADEEAGSTGIQWLIANAWSKIDAEFAINEGGYAMDTSAGVRLFQVQTSEKVPTRVVLTAQGTAGHGSLPRADNPVVRLARAITRLAEADQPVSLTTTTRRYLREISRLPDYQWLGQLLPKLEDASSAPAAARAALSKDSEIAAILHTTVSPTMLEAGVKINVIPNTAGAQVDVRRLPNETREEVMARFRRIINDTSVKVEAAGGQDMPSTEPSSLTTPLYLAMEKALSKAHPKSLVVPYMTRGATDGAYLRHKGMAVYGAPVFLRTDKESRAHGNDERLGLASFDAGVGLLWEIVTAVAVQ
ncbi:MAG: M20/M25/M40 family metallo-hydrolase [Acidobacteriia bacterium]|nr:M20/M25/M40 family metallo-hydrolase [Terriglobia bacterium]